MRAGSGRGGSSGARGVGLRRVPIGEEGVGPENVAIHRLFHGF